MQTVTVARNAMATRFEIVLHGDDQPHLRAAGEEALDEIDRLEAQLSLYRPSSEIARLNAGAARQPIRVTPLVFQLLQRACILSQETRGAFDITVGPLVRLWGFMDQEGRVPSATEIERARRCVGPHHLVFDPEHQTVLFDCDGVMVDLGGIGKGFALERAAELLKEAGISSALLHGGTSTVVAIGAPPGLEAWTVGMDRPMSPDRAEAAPSPGNPGILCRVPLRNAALSVSGVQGKSFTQGGRTFGHVLDPASGTPVSGAWMAAVVLPDATETDALSTALLTAGITRHKEIFGLRPGMRTVLVTPSNASGGSSVESFGWPGGEINCPLKNETAATSLNDHA